LNLGQNILTVKTEYTEKPAGDGWTNLSTSDQNQGHFKALANSSLFDGFLTADGELAYSSFDPKSLKGLGDHRHQLLRFGLKGGWMDLNYGAEYRSVGKGFATLAGPAILGDQEGGEVWAQQNFGTISLKAYASQFSDNVKLDPGNPRTTKTQWGTTVNIAPPSWPVLGLFYSRGFLATSKEPVYFHPQRGTLEFFGTSLVYGAKTWDVTLSSMYSVTDVRNRPTSQESVTVLSPLVSSYFPSPRVRSDTPALFLGLNFRPTIAPVQLITLGSYTKAKASNGFTNSNAINLSGSLIWNLGNSVVGMRSLSIRTSYYRYLYSVHTNNSKNNTSVWIQLKIASF
jgi:hypothetical protein